MSEHYIKAEIVKPMDAATWVSDIFESLLLLAIQTFFVWWAVAVWFPELGITYWQAVLPVYAIRTLVTSNGAPWRLLKK